MARWTCWMAALALLGGGAGAAHATPALNVQIINVCNDDGSGCALSNEAATLGISYNVPAIQDVFAQAGINVNVLAPVQFNSTAFLNPAVVDDPSGGYQTGSPTDLAHQLLDLPGHDQNTDSNVLNVFVVNSLPHTTVVNGVSTPASTLYGLGLENANGAIVTTGITPINGSNYVAPLDNIAHELGHNLGLVHVDAPPLAGTPIDTPQNLMTSSNRNLPNTLCGITGVSCNSSGQVVPAGDPTTATVGIKDVLAPSQIQQVQSAVSNLFTVNLADVTSNFNYIEEVTSPAAYSCGMYQPTAPFYIGGCSGTISFAPSASTSVLNGVRIRFLNASLAGFGAVTDFGNGACPATSMTEATLPTGGVELDATFAPGCFTAGVTDDFDITNSTTNLTPFSIEYDFDDGVTSTSAFDMTGTVLSASSLTPIAIGNLSTPDQNGPALLVPTDPTLYNAVNVPEDDRTPYVPDPAPDGTPVPEPGTAGLLGVGALGLAVFHRRRITGAPRAAPPSPPPRAGWHQ